MGGWIFREEGREKLDAGLHVEERVWGVGCEVWVCGVRDGVFGLEGVCTEGTFVHAPSEVCDVGGRKTKEGERAIRRDADVFQEVPIDACFLLFPIPCICRKDERSF